MTRIDELREKLGPTVRAKMDAARANRDPAATDAATDAAGLPRASSHGGAIDVHPLPGDLTAEQRAVAEIIALEGLSFYTTAMPEEPGTILRWLGRAPATALEQEVPHGTDRVPLWRALQELAQDRATARASTTKLLEQLPMDTRLEVVASCGHERDPYRIRMGADFAWDFVMAQSLAGEGTAWARRVLEAHRAGDDVGLPEWLAFFTLVRAQVAIDPSWDDCLPISMDVDAAVAVQCAAAIPDPRRETAIMARLDTTHAHFAIQLSLALAAHFDLPALARLVITKSERSAPRDRTRERATLVGIASRQPRIASVVTELLGKRGKTPAPATATRGLRLANRRKPFEATLETTSPVLRAQLESLIAGDLDTASHPLADLFGDALDSEDVPMKQLEMIDVVETKTSNVVANLFLYPHGDGALVHAGTSKTMATIVQHGITADPGTSKAWMADFAHAWHTGARTIGVTDPGHFDIEVPAVAVVAKAPVAKKKTAAVKKKPAARKK